MSRQTIGLHAAQGSKKSLLLLVILEDGNLPAPADQGEGREKPPSKTVKLQLDIIFSCRVDEIFPTSRGILPQVSCDGNVLRLSERLLL